MLNTLFRLSSWLTFQPNPFSPIHPIESSITRLLAEAREYSRRDEAIAALAKVSDSCHFPETVQRQQVNIKKHRCRTIRFKQLIIYCPQLAGPRLTEIILVQLEEIFEGKQIEFETEKFSTQVNFKRLKNETVDNLFGKPSTGSITGIDSILPVLTAFSGKISISLQGLFEQFAKFEKGWERCFAILIEQFPAIRKITFT